MFHLCIAVHVATSVAAVHSTHLDKVPRTLHTGLSTSSDFVRSGWLEGGEILCASLWLQSTLNNKLWWYFATLLAYAYLLWVTQRKTGYYLLRLCRYTPRTYVEEDMNTLPCYAIRARIDVRNSYIVICKYTNLTASVILHELIFIRCRVICIYEFIVSL